MLLRRPFWPQSRLIGLGSSGVALTATWASRFMCAKGSSCQRTLSSAGKDYEDAIAILNSCRRTDRPKAQDQSNPNGLVPLDSGPSGTPDLRGRPSITGMQEWLGCLGYSLADINRLNVIHVAGTKGKGSTCAFIESFLRTHGKRTGFPKRTGLYTSPHLKQPEERIRIDFEPISRLAFTKYFFEVWDALHADMDRVGTPRYLQLYALVSFHAFIREGVDVAIYETHHGGEYDATNIISNPIVTAIATLGMDHVEQLGPGIENIAWHKAGIMKPGAIALAAPQEAAAAAALEERAREKGVSIRFAGPATAPAALQAVQPEVQRINGALAHAAVNAFLATKADTQLSSADIQQGVAKFQWPGRFQLVAQGAIQWFLESAHNELSMSQAAEWFTQSTRGSGDQPSAKKVLIFSQQSKVRDGQRVLESLAKALRDRDVVFDYVLFTSYIPSESTPKQEYPLFGVRKPEGGQGPEIHLERFGNAWRAFDDKAVIRGFVYIEDAMKFVTNLDEDSDGSDLQVLVTGSQHLVGGVLRLLDGIV